MKVNARDVPGVDGVSRYNGRMQNGRCGAEPWERNQGKKKVGRHLYRAVSFRKL